ncbi:MAG: FlgD immunoglobulin-like domain containing protein [Spirochaetales bacterium]|nr:FlgD immunoglobulin-like domain containing protein [Spirochaetales bacterium]
MFIEAMYKFFVESSTQTCKHVKRFRLNSFFKHFLCFYIFIFSFTTKNIFAADYYWLGTPEDVANGIPADPDGNWSDGSKWNTEVDGSGTTGTVPGASDNANFVIQCTVNIDSASVTVDKLFIPSSNSQTTSFEVTLTGNALTVTNEIETFRTAGAGADANGTSTLNIECNLTAAELRMHSGGNITIASSSDAEINSIINTGGAAPATLLKIEGNLTCSTGVDLSAVATRKMEISSGGKVVTSSFSGSDNCVKNNGELQLSGNFDGALLDVSGNGKIIFDGASDQAFSAGTKNYSSIEFEVNKSSGNFSTTGSATFGTINILSCDDLSFASSVIIDDLEITLCNDLTFSSTAELATLEVTSANDVTFDAGATIDDFTINSAGDVNFNGNASINDLTIDSAGDIKFEGNAGLGNFSLTSANSTIFNGNTNIQIFSDSAGAGEIKFLGSGTICSGSAAAQTFSTTSNLILGNGSSSVINIGTGGSKNFTHTTGKTIINGNVNAKDITLDEVDAEGSINAENITADNFTLTENLVIQSAAGKLVKFEGTVTGNSHNLEIKNSSAQFDSTVSGIGIAKIYDGLIKNSFTCTTLNAGHDLTIDTTGSVNCGTGSINNNLVNNGEIHCTSTLTVSNDALCFGNSVLQAVSSTGNAITVGKNFTVAASAGSDTCTINGSLSADNIVAYGNNISIYGNMSAAKDLLLYGNYNPVDSVTGLAIFSYLECAAAFSDVTTYNGTNYYATTLTNGSSLPVAVGGTAAINLSGGTIAVAAGSVVSAGENFYANGITFNAPLAGDGSNEWILKIKKNKNVNTNFAIAINSDFSAANCKVYGWNGSGSGTAASATNDELKIVCEGSTSVPSTGAYSFGWDNEDLVIVTTDADKPRTLSDNVVKIKFNREIRNLDDQLTNGCSADNKYLKPSTAYYRGMYTNFESNIQPTAGITNLTELYIKSNANWNTSATGASSGSSGDTDATGTHRTVLPTIELLRAGHTAFNGNTSTGKKSYFVTDLWGKRSKHYSTGGTGAEGIYTDTIDECPPVLVAVKTGQEVHEEYSAGTGASSQHSYDAHNFIEFIYSEPVNFGSEDNSVCDVWLPAYNGAHGTSGSFQAVENVAVTDSFGALTGDVSASGNLTFAGLGITIASGKIHTKQNGLNNKYVNALYRTNERSLRISIAGLTAGTENYKGQAYKKWVGYIESAISPAGTVSLPGTTSSPWTNNLIKDMKGNGQSSKVKKSSLSVESTASGIYGPWDVSKPVFAKLNTDASWTRPSGIYEAEALANVPGSGSTLDRIEFHFFDNDPVYNSSEPYWRSGIGWCSQGGASLVNANSYAADIFGGSKGISGSSQTGGIRVSTLIEAYNNGAFSYGVVDSLTSSSGQNFASITLGTSSPFFTGSSSPYHTTSEHEGLYFTMGLSDTTLPVNSTFTVSYAENSTYAITDLAGNKLDTVTIRTLDKTPPSFDITLSPLAKNKINMIFVKKILTDASLVHYSTSGASSTSHLSDTTSQSYSEFIPGCFEIITIDDSGTATVATAANDLQINASIPAEISHIRSNSSGISFTKITLTTNREINLEDLQKYYVRVINPAGYGQSNDPFTNISSWVTFIQDETGNYIQMNTAHAISDFAINAVNPQFAAPNSLDFGNESSLENPWTARDFGREQQNFGTLPLNESFDLIASLNDGSNSNSIFASTDSVTGERNYGIKTYFCSAPDADAVSRQINEDLNLSLRIWLPKITGTSFTTSIFRALCDKNIDPAINSTLSALKADYKNSGNSNQIIVSPSKDKVTQWSKNGEVQFLFTITNGDTALAQEISFCSAPVLNPSGTGYSVNEKLPLFAIRLENDSDILSLDLWSIKFKGIKNQRGGVTILNNVINPEKDEECVVKINMPQEGNLNVIVMTPDGNVVKYLSHGRLSEGEHYFTWDGKNKNGKSVARGIYFIRVNGNDIDESRKVMIVK